MYAYMDVWMYVCMCRCNNICTYIHTRTHTYACMHTHTHQNPARRAPRCPDMFASTHEYVLIYALIQYIHNICIHAYKHMHVCIHIHTEVLHGGHHVAQNSTTVTRPGVYLTGLPCVGASQFVSEKWCMHSRLLRKNGHGIFGAQETIRAQQEDTHEEGTTHTLSLTHTSLSLSLSLSLSQELHTHTLSLSLVSLSPFLSRTHTHIPASMSAHPKVVPAAQQRSCPARHRRIEATCKNEMLSARRQWIWAALKHAMNGWWPCFLICFLIFLHKCGGFEGAYETWLSSWAEERLTWWLPRLRPSAHTPCVFVSIEWDVKRTMHTCCFMHIELRIMGEMWEAKTLCTRV